MPRFGAFKPQAIRKFSSMASQTYRGQRLEGRKGVYNVLRPLSQKHENIWLASDPKAETVLIKNAPSSRLKNEREALELCRGQEAIRQLFDVIDDPQLLVLAFLDRTLYGASCEQKLDRQDAKRAVETALRGLSTLHAHKRAHTDLKPNNILANRGPTDNSRFSTIQLADLGDSVPGDVSTDNGEHIISAPIYRVPEVMLNARWTVAAICYLLRRHIFVPQGLEPDDELFALAVLILHNKYFGPFPGKFFELLKDYDESTAILRYVLDQCGIEAGSFSRVDAGILHPDDRDFILYLMKPDPRDRPPAAEALMHPWLRGQ